MAKIICSKCDEESANCCYCQYCWEKLKDEIRKLKVVNKILEVQEKERRKNECNNDNRSSKSS